MITMVSNKALKENEFEPESIELARDNSGQQVYGDTGFPKPHHRYRVVLESPHESIEEWYFWLLEHIRVAQAHPHVDKIEDIFGASEQSSFFGTAQQRLGMQQEKVSMFLATIGKMVKELFQLVREIRILKERLTYYEDAMKPESKSRESAEIALKGIWVDMVEQGAKNPASVYGMARELQFTTLPDLFYSINPRTREEVDKRVDSLEFNAKIKEVLKRKLRQYIEWRESTYKEIQNRHTFTLKYLRQHFDIIKMYISWVKPYLRNIRRMSMHDMTESPELISAFEGSLIELEFLAKRFPSTRNYAKRIEHNEVFYSVILARFDYRTKPQMNYMQEYQRGPLHIGSVDITLRAYAWDQKTIDKYKKMKEHEDLELLGHIDASVKAAMEALGDELESYLQEAGEKIEFPKEAKEPSAKDKAMQAVDPFTSVAKGFGELFGAFKSKKTGPKKTKVELAAEKKLAQSSCKAALWQTYKNFKKNNGLLSW